MGEKLQGFVVTVRGGEFFGLIDGNQQGRPVTRGRRDSAQQPCEAVLLQIGPHLCRARDVPGRGERGLQAAQQTLRTRHRRALGADRRQDDEGVAVAPQPWQEAGAQERRFARTRGTEYHEELFDTALAEQPQLVDRAHDRCVAAEEDGSVGFVQGAQTGIRWAPRFGLGRPEEGRRVEPGFLQATRQCVEARAWKADRGFRHGRHARDVEAHRVERAREVADLPLGRHLLRQLRERHRLNDHAKDALA